MAELFAVTKKGRNVSPATRVIALIIEGLPGGLLIKTPTTLCTLPQGQWILLSRGS